LKQAKPRFSDQSSLLSSVLQSFAVTDNAISQNQEEILHMKLGLLLI
jgi:hypothetical protein